MKRALQVSAIVFLLALLAGIVRSQQGGFQSPPLGTSYTGTSPIVVSGSAISCPSCGTGTGNVSTAAPLASGNVVTGAASDAVQDSGTALTALAPIASPTFTTQATAPKFISTVATGTAPLTVASTTVVANLNAASLNGQTFAAPAALGSSSPNSVNWSSLLNQAHMVCTGANPTIGTGAGATIASGNGSCSFTINVGTGGLSSIVIAFSGTSVQSGWICSANDRTTHSATVFQTVQTNSALSTTTATISNLTSAGATGTAWTNSDLLSLQCAAD